MRRLESLAEISPLRGFAIVYGGKPLGVFGAVGLMRCVENFH